MTPSITGVDMNEPDPGDHDAVRIATPRWKRQAFAVAGVFLATIGLIGLVLPLMPTTIFMILAAGCFARSSPSLEARLLNHPTFGPPIRTWQEKGAISHTGKIAAVSGIALGLALFWMVPTALGAKLIASVIMAAIAWWIWSRPDS